jgi:hypothetical protein
MSVTTKTHTNVGVQVWARSTTYVSNEIIRVAQEIVQRRGLTMDYMHKHGELFVNSFRTWITGRYLHGVVLEIWENDGGTLRERYDLNLSYDMNGNRSERFDTHIERLRSLLSQRHSLPPGAGYRLVVQLDAGAPELPGWSSTSLRDTTGLSRQNLGGMIDTSRIGVEMDCWF